MSVTLAKVLTSVESTFNEWARDKDKSHRSHKKNDLDSFIDIISALNLSRNNVYSEILSDLTNRAVFGACCCPKTVRGEQWKGTEAFRRHEYSRAADCFTEALAYLDRRKPELNKRLAQLHNSRALCLIWLGQHHYAVEECSLALQYSPRSDTAYFRKAVALRKQGRLHEAIQCATDALEISRSSGAHSAGRDAALFVQGMLEELESSAVEESKAPQPESIACKTLPVVEVKQTVSEGRALALVDHRGAEAGELLLAEDAFVHTVCKPHRRKLCHYCLEALPAHAGIPCQACPLAWYCCAQHRELDAHHVPGGASCGVPWPVLLPEQLVLATRLAAMMQSTSQDQAIGLETHVHDVPSHQLFQESVICCIAAACGRLAPQLVLKAYRQVVINAIAITPVQHASAEDRLGLAIYPRAAMLNHACTPNVTAAFRGSRLHIRVISDLSPGTTLRFCYGPQSGESIREVRRRQLMQQYHFLCRCSACEATYSAAHEARLVGLKCPTCGGPVVPCIECPAGLCSMQELPSCLAGSGTCYGCGARMAEAEQDSRLARLSHANVAYMEACGLLSQDSGDLPQALRLMRNCLEVQEELLAPSNQVLGRTHDALSRAHAQHGDVDHARQHAERALYIVGANYGDGHLAVAHQRERIEALAILPSR